MYYIELSTGQEIKKTTIKALITMCNNLLKNNIDFKIFIKTGIIKGYIMEHRQGEVCFINHTQQIPSYYNEDIKVLMDKYNK